MVQVEALFKHIWWDVDILEARPSSYLVRFVGTKLENAELDPMLVRYKGRKAAPGDCPLLTEGTDVCVFSSHPQVSTRQGWYDARIICTSREPHVSGCTCSFSILFYDIHAVRAARVLFQGSPTTVSLDRLRILLHLPFAGVQPPTRPIEDGSASSLQQNEPANIVVPDSEPESWVDLDTDLSKLISDSELEDPDTSLAKLGVVSDSEPEDPDTSSLKLGVVSDSEPEDSDTNSSKLGVVSDSELDDPDTSSSKLGVVSDSESEDPDAGSSKLGVVSDSELDDPDTSSSKLGVVSDSEPEDPNTSSSKLGDLEEYAMYLEQVIGSAAEIEISSSNYSDSDSDVRMRRRSARNAMKEVVDCSEDSDRRRSSRYGSHKRATKGQRQQVSSSYSDSDSDVQARNAMNSPRRRSRCPSAHKRATKSSLVVLSVSYVFGPSEEVSGHRKKRLGTKSPSLRRPKEASTYKNDSPRRPKEASTSKNDFQRKPREPRLRKGPASERPSQQSFAKRKLAAAFESKWKRARSHLTSTKAVEAEDGLDIEQGYVVSLSPYWKRMDNPDNALQHAEFMQAAAHPESQANHEANNIDGLCKNHDFELDDLEGVICRECGYIALPIERMAGKPTGVNFFQWMKPGKEHQVSSEEEDELDEATIKFAEIAEDVKLLVHQKKALAFLKRNIVDEGGGCILAHAPGTGKTCTSITFYRMFREMHSNCKLLVLAPKIMLIAWQMEFEKWKAQVRVHVLSATMNHRCKREMIALWRKEKSVLSMTYTLFASLSEKNDFQDILRLPDLVVLDEGHFPRNGRSNINRALRKLKTQKRILLTGTLFQNNFTELFNLYFLVRPSFIRNIDGFENLDGDLDEKLACKLFERLASNLGEDQEKETQEEARETLLKLTRNFTDCYRGSLLKQLPGLYEYDIWLELTPLQTSFYERAVPLVPMCTEANIILTYICIHPYLLAMLGESNMSRIRVKELMDEVKSLEGLADDCSAGPKLKFTVELIRLCTSKMEKVLVFSDNLEPLNYLAKFLGAAFGWHENREIIKIRGAMKDEEKQQKIELVNSTESNARVCLATFKACSEGITLTGVSRVVFLHSLWNPSQLQQAASRAFRIGQTRKVYVYSLHGKAPSERSKYEKIGWKHRMATMIGQVEALSSKNSADILTEDELLAELRKELAFEAKYPEHNDYDGQNNGPAPRAPRTSKLTTAAEL